MSDFWQIAKDMEKQGEDFYRTLADSSTRQELVGVFNRLADEEVKHRELFDLMQKGVAVGGHTVKTTLAVDVKDAFARMAEGFEETSAVEDTETVYEKALSLEVKGIEFYTELKEKVSDEGLRCAIDFVIDQERTHARIMEALVNFSREPKQWVENGEFVHLDEY